MKLINIGFGNMVSTNRLVAIVSPDSAPIKRIIQEARDRGMCIDATYGRRTRAVIVTDSDHVILSAIQPETVANRLYDRRGQIQLCMLRMSVRSVDTSGEGLIMELRVRGGKNRALDKWGGRSQLEEGILCLT